MTESGRRVLIAVVEDNPADVLLVREALKAQKLPFEIKRFEDGEEAIQALCPDDGSPRLQPDLILIDLNLPRSSGLDVLKSVRECPTNNSIPAAILTSSESPHDQKRAMALGADRYIFKPTRLDDYLSTVGLAIKELLAPR
ncbi:MAG TPA: response regulator [Bryobacteraceae bacterium]|nr:response regulator [Bryobacteraceae bacterium]